MKRESQAVAENSYETSNLQTFNPEFPFSITHMLLALAFKDINVYCLLFQLQNTEIVDIFNNKSQEKGKTI